MSWIEDAIKNKFYKIREEIFNEIEEMDLAGYTRGQIESYFLDSARIVNGKMFYNLTMDFIDEYFG